jgi:hypothetical protein
MDRAKTEIAGFLLGLALGAAGMFVGWGIWGADPAPLSPVEAYCRGAVDGRTSAIMQVQIYNPSPEELDGYEAQCRADTSDDDLLPGARGPILPGAGE